MKIKVCDENASKIEAALHESAGSAARHAFRDFAELAALAREAESRLQAALGSSARAKRGAMIRATSGEPVAKKYSYPRRGNAVHMIRGGNDWFLTVVEPRRLYSDQGGRFNLLLTHEQYDQAARRQAREIGFGVQPAQGV